MIKQIISGGQTGADQAGLAAAKELGIPTGGYAPRGWLTEAGPNQALLEGYGLREAATNRYSDRTRANVAISDVTIVFGNPNSPGSQLTVRHCGERHKPYMLVPFGEPEAHKLITRAAAMVRTWLEQLNPEVVNIAGNRESTNPGIFAFTKAVLLQALKQGD